MSVIDTTTLRANGFAFAPRLTRAAEAFVARLVTKAERRATRAALASLTDRELTDIGLTRWDVTNRF